MDKHRVRTPSDAVAYLVDCSLATVSSMAMLKSRKKGEYERQILIAQQGIDWMYQMHIELSGRAKDVQQAGDVAKWAIKYENND